MTVGELKKLLSRLDDDLEVKPYVKDLTKKVQFWYFRINENDIDVKNDGVYIELD